VLLVSNVSVGIYFMISKAAKYLLVFALGWPIAHQAQADCDNLFGKRIRLSNGGVLHHSQGDLFRASGLDSDTYSLWLQQQKYVFMRVSYEHFKCFD
jgi:hypothetical protein